MDKRRGMPILLAPGEQSLRLFRSHWLLRAACPASDNQSLQNLVPQVHLAAVQVRCLLARLQHHTYTGPHLRMFCQAGVLQRDKRREAGVHSGQSVPVVLAAGEHGL